MKIINKNSKKIIQIINDIIEENKKIKNQMNQNNVIFYDVNDLARIMKISTKTAYSLMRTKDFPTQGFGRKKIIEATALQRYTAVKRTHITT